MKCLMIILVQLFAVTALFADNFSIRRGEIVNVYVQKTKSLVSSTAFSMLAKDAKAVLDSDFRPCGSVKKSKVVVRLQSEGEIPAVGREGFRMYVADGKLNIVASDAHGMAYGMLEISRLLGVSPWEWWADCTPRSMPVFSLDEHFSVVQNPKVAYRGMFINDEDWGMNPWATRREPGALSIKHGRIVGAIGPETNARLFELMLRLRQNYYWPAMHECTQPFFLTKGNREMAAKYGIYIGGSHCEPMACSAAAEWGIRGEGAYNYVNNADCVRKFWQDRLNDVKNQEIVYTIGMRGVHDGAMEGTKTREDKLKYLQQVIDDQREMLSRTLHRNASDIPQVFIPYKEVLDVYRDGLRVPEDVTLMWTDDNYGYVRQFPTADERKRKGGNGLYYHLSYWGRPHDYLWLATMSPYLIEQQLTEAYNRGIQQMWVLNVGDVKPAEFEIELFSDLAWYGTADSVSRMEMTAKLLREFYEREFGASLSLDIADIMNEFYRLAWERKPEHMAGSRTEEPKEQRPYWEAVHAIDYWSKQDVINRVAAYRALSDRVESLWNLIPTDRQDAFFQLVKYPVQGCAQMNFKFLCPEMSESAHDSIVALTKIYNEGYHNNGKWQGIMSASPRGLTPFKKISQSQVPDYPLLSQWNAITPSFAHTTFGTEVKGLGARGGMLFVPKDAEKSFDVGCDTHRDTLTLRVRLLPNLPVDGNKLTFSLSVDGCQPVTMNYETYDRSEEWKRNVLRNYAECIVNLPVQKKGKHVVTFKALSDGVLLHDISLKVDSE